MSALLSVDDTELEIRWNRLTQWIEDRFGKQPEIEYILFLIGVQERGHGYQPRLEKEVKQALIMEGTYTVFAGLGFYEQVGMDETGAWIWERQQSVPPLDLAAQEKLLRIAILTYFEPILTLK